MLSGAAQDVRHAAGRPAAVLVRPAATARAQDSWRGKAGHARPATGAPSA